MTNLFSKKTCILIFLAIFLAAGLVVVAVRSGSKDNSDSQEKQSAGAKKETLANLTTPTPSQVNQADQTNQPDQISSIDKSAQENLGGDYKVDGASFVAEPKEKNGVKVQVGDPSAKEVLPELTLSRWDETKMTLKPNLDGIAAKDQLVSFEKDKIKFDTPKVAYSLENMPASTERPEGGFEYNIVLKEKPATNVVSLGMETENLDFFYQPALTPEEVSRGASRPENVVGSYAVYYKDGKSGDYTALGGKNYMAGKAFHIYRPRIDDSAGNWTWGDLHIDENAGLLTVTIPQDFLDNAVYPVSHAAGLEFGYHSIGGSIFGNLRSYQTAVKSVAGGGSPALPASSGTLNTIVAYLELGGASTWDIGLYTDLSGLPKARLAATTGGAISAAGGTDWFSGDLLYGGITSDTQYWLAVARQTMTYNLFAIYCDTIPSGVEISISLDNPVALPDTWSTGYNGYKFRCSIYATYTPPPSGTPINIKSNVNFGNNVNLK